MLTIVHEDVKETVLLGDLFNQLGFSDTSSPTDDSGDSYTSIDWSLEALSLDGYYPIEGIRWTKPETVVRLIHHPYDQNQTDDSLPFLTCAPEHLVLKKTSQTTFEWTAVNDLTQNDVIVVNGCSSRVVTIEQLSIEERLCDLQVGIAHSYFTNGVLSHNSHFLTMIGANALRENKNVLHYTFELSETAVGIRYDSNLCDIDSSEIMERKEDVKKFYDETRLGRLFIKEYPTNTASVHTLRAHIERLSLKGFKPDMVVIDYADIMRSSRQFDSLRHELKLVYEELRGLAMELQVPIWTASQSNKEGASSDVVDVTNMSEAYGKAMICDFIASISRRPHEKATGWGRLYVAKNRAGRDGIIFPIRIDTARSKFEIVGEADVPQNGPSEEEAQRKSLREKWKELKSTFAERKDEQPAVDELG